MEGTAQNHGQNLEPEQAAAKATLLAECDKLAAGGVTFVAVHFDGYGDDGATEEVKCYDSAWYAWGEHEPVNYEVHTCRNTSKLWCRSDTRTTAADLEMSFSMWRNAR
jgi:hypothetical protein